MIKGCTDVLMDGNASIVGHVAASLDPFMSYYAPPSEESMMKYADHISLTVWMDDGSVLTSP